MYKTVTETRKFDTENPQDLQEYSAIHNDPLCMILNERREKLTEKEFGENGHIANQSDRVILVVTWEKKVLS